MSDLRFFTYISMVVIGSIMLGYAIATDNNCNHNQSIVQCLFKETK